jgi:hypothetical protein
MVAPEGILDISTVSATVTAEYRFAADHAEHYRQLRCWCGCEKAFAHKSLADCFVRADGAWEAHGAGCGVCLGEAATAHVRLDAGDDPADIARDLDAEYGPAMTTTGA